MMATSLDRTGRCCCGAPVADHYDRGNVFIGCEGAAVAKTSKTQQGVIDKLRETHAVLVRVPGGFWTFDRCDVNAAGIPAWWVTWQTVRAMERQGLLQRTGRFTESWRDDRALVESGL